MKKIYVLLSCFLPLISTAQLTVTQANLPAPGLTYIMGTDSASGTIPAGGANQTWDYSLLNNAQPDTNSFIAAAGTPFQSSFPSANLASTNPATGNWVYYKTDSTGFYINGLTNPALPNGMISYVPPLLYAPVPFTYNDTRTVVSRIVVDTVYMGINARLVRNTSESFLADGWGTLILPSGTYNNVLRTKITEIVRDSAYYDPLGIGLYFVVPDTIFTPTRTQTTYYRWVQNQQPAYLLGITADSSGTAPNYSEYLVSAVLSTQDIHPTQAQLQAYPNPASNFVSIENVKTGEQLVIYNSLGQEVEARSPGNEKTISVNVESYSNGLYQFSIVSGTEKRTGRFTVQH